MDWQEVGQWLKSNAGVGASLVGALLTGNVPGAVAAGVAMVSSATGSASPDEALASLQTNPSTVLRLRELALQDAEAIRAHLRQITEQQLQDAQAEQHETQETIRAGDRAEDAFVRRTRPGQSWVSLLAALAYVFVMPSPDATILGLLLTLPWAYAGLRQIGKGVDALASARAATK